jgi:hypothetical protein
MRLTVAALAVALAASTTAIANPYEAFIDIETEEDLYDLFAAQQITEETFEVLLDLYHRGVDLNTAGRAELYSLPNLTYDDVDAILAYRSEQGFIRDPAELVAARVITDDQLLSIAAFLLVRDPFAGRTAVRGVVRGQTRFTIGDDRAPPFALMTRVLIGRDLAVGAAVVVTRLSPSGVAYDPNRDALLVDAPAVRARLPKIYVAYQTDDVDAIAGSYRIGFAQRLTFDNSSDYTPNGIYRDDQLFREDGLARSCRLSRGELDASPCADDFHYVTPDYRWRDGLFGVAAGLKHLAIGDGWAQLHGWGSYQPRSIYQYQLYDAGRCDDPRDDDAAGCAAPDVFIRPDGDRLTPAPKLSYSTLPDMYAEALVGGNATYFLSRRNYVGVTGYGATVRWLVDDAPGGDDDLRLDFQEWAQRPMGGAFGAGGLAASVGMGRLDLGGEVAHSFDSMADGRGAASGGGGPGAIARATWTEPGAHETELSVRYYDVNFVNPYARPIAAPDQFEGQRARDELGVRAKFTGELGRLRLRSFADLWTNPSRAGARPESRLYVRADVDASKTIRWGLWGELRNHSLAAEEDGDFLDLEDLEEQFDFQVQAWSTTARLRWRADRKLSLSAQLRHKIYEVDDTAENFQDVSAWLIALYKPTRDLSLRGRIRYLSEDLADSTKLEESLWMYVDAGLRMRQRDRLRLRADLYVYLDDRTRTRLREPSPELWLWAQYEAKF